MLLTCAKCETIFKIDAAAIPKEGRRVRCTICDHVWAAEPRHLSPPPQKTESSGQALLIGILALLILFSGLSVSRHTITAIAPGLIPIYHRLGMEISSNLQAVEVQGLKAERQRNMIHLSGDAMNTSSWPIHAPDLRVVVSNAFGHSLQDEIISLNEGVIASKEAARFAHQLTLEMNLADDVITEITVTPIQKRVALP